MAVIKHKLSKRQALPDCLAREVELRLQLLVFGGYIRSLLTRQLSEPHRRGYRISEVSFPHYVTSYHKFVCCLDKSMTISIFFSF